jgi:uncharacterized protein (TIGR03437 family)
MRLIAALLFLTATGVAIAQPTVGGVVNGASFVQGQAIAPGSLISIFGTKLANSQAAASTIPISTTLNGVTVKFVTGNTTINAPLAPLLFLQSDQINAVVPWDLLPGNAAKDVSVIVTNKGVASAEFSVKAAEFSPAIFSIGDLAAVQNVDGSLAQAEGSITGRATHPAKIGDVVVIYATGLGPVDKTVADGDIPPSGKAVNTLKKPSVLFGGHTAQIQFSGLSPQFVGVYQLNVVVPDVVAGDKIPIQLVLGGIASPSTITVAVSQ